MTRALLTLALAVLALAAFALLMALVLAPCACGQWTPPTFRGLWY